MGELYFSFFPGALLHKSARYMDWIWLLFALIVPFAPFMLRFLRAAKMPVAPVIALSHGGGTEPHSE